MMITKMSLPRRTFLRGMGATLALPLLDAMVPAFTALAKTPAAPVRRFGVVYVPNGMIMESWTPRREGPLELSPILQPLESYRDQLQILSGRPVRRSTRSRLKSLASIRNWHHWSSLSIAWTLSARVTTPRARSSIRSRGPVRRRRFLAKTIHAWCSRGYLETAAR